MPVVGLMALGESETVSSKGDRVSVPARSEGMATPGGGDSSASSI
jgi:hypothetical protein